MHSALRYLCALISLLALHGCETNEPENNAQLKITVEETSCTEAWVKIEYTSGFRISLQRDGTEIANFRLTGNDTTIIDETLEPSKTYNYAADVTIFDGHLKTEASARTLDTTSHEFEWEISSFGFRATSALYDVYVLNENDIWAAGIIYLSDSTGEFDPLQYGAAHWNGYKWEIRRIMYRSLENNYFSLETNGVFCFSPEDIWFIGGDVFHYYKNKTTSFWITSFYEHQGILPEGVILYQIFGFSPTDIYVGGEKGGLAHYDGNKWTKIETNMEGNITDIWGYIDSKTRTKEVFFSTTDPWYNQQDICIFRMNELNPILYEEFTPEYSISSLWMINDKKIYMGGDGFYVGTKGNWKKIKELPANYKNKVRGTGLNDVYIVDQFGIVNHFNGKTWKSMNVLGAIGGSINSVSVKDNVVAIVGTNGDKAIAAIGRRK
jgi:hypothetical protein